MLERIAQWLGFDKAKAPKDNFVQRRILVVDDNEIDLKVVARTIEKIGHEALTAVNGEEGFQLAKAQKPDLILSDCRMPQMDGVEMCKRLKEDEVTKDIPLVFLTSVDTPGTVVECFDLGVDNYICKPIRPKLLSSQIRAIFNDALPV